MVETRRELELDVEPEAVTDLLKSHENTLTDEKLLLRDEQRKWLLDMESIPHEDAAKLLK